MKQIVCLSTSNFYPYPTRKQNVMTRLADAEILYFDPPVSYLAPLKDPSAKARLRAYRNEGVKAAENITVYALPPVLPFFNRFRLINRLNQRRQARYIRKRMRQHGFDTPYLWCYSPTACDVVDHVPHTLLVYDCVDRHSAYKGMISPRVVDKQEEDLSRKCDIVFCTAQGLYERLVEFNRNTHFIPNGANYELFVQAASPEKAVDTAHPVFGFVGALQDCIAYDYLLALADAYPHGEIRLVGKEMPGIDLSALKAKPNVYFDGLLPQQELPDRIREFDVCLNLFASGDLAKDVSPLKFYEYLATGKPIVSTREPLQVNDYAAMIYIADNTEDFLTCCGQALEESVKAPERKEQRLQAGRDASWDKRVEQMEYLLANIAAAQVE